MKQLFTLVLLLTNFFLFSQNQTTKEIKKIKIEDSNGNLITDSIQIEQFLTKRNTEIEANKKLRFRATLSPAHLCSNNNFEEFENIWLKGENHNRSTNNPSLPVLVKPEKPKEGVIYNETSH